jgi:hypothetical protein
MPLADGSESAEAGAESESDSDSESTRAGGVTRTGPSRWLRLRV